MCWGSRRWLRRGTSTAVWDMPSCGGPGVVRWCSGSTRHTDTVHGVMRAGTSAVYVVSDDVDAVHRRVVAAEGEVLEPPHETRFGSGAAAFVCTVRDPEGNLWTFGTYRGPSPE
ncbi:VOC family protein [Streptomyces sp. NPDC091649]|uniref:VOC family protein n=2 Tax=unclassified Streptomyces TaxID=2593676 RepID=UPI00380B22E0